MLKQRVLGVMVTGLVLLYEFEALKAEIQTLK